ncbi:MAG: response regulator, partial [bacterium]|nr:response regulator [bacterium]
TVWAGTYNGGLNRLDKSTGRFYRFPISARDRSDFIGRGIYSIYEDTEEYLWIGTRDNGLIRLDRKNNEFRKFLYDKRNSYSISSNRVIAIFEDRSGLLWAGTDRGGINVYDRLISNFKLINNTSNPDFNKQNGLINTLLEDSDGNIWIGFDNGLEKLDPESGTIKRLFEERDTDDTVTQYYVMTLYEEENGDIWIGTRFSGLIKYIKNTDSFEYFSNDPDDQSSLSNNYVTAIIRNSSGELLIGTWEGGIYVFDDDTGEFSIYEITGEEGNSLDIEYIHKLKEDNDGNLWIGTFAEGLIKYDKNSSQSVKFTHNPEDSTTVQGNKIEAIFEDSSGDIWIGTITGGLSKFNRSDNKFIRYTDHSILKDDLIYSIFEDGNGYIWFCSDKRVARFDPDNEVFLYFYIDYWFNGNEIIDNCGLINDKGEIYFGGTEGISHFYPDSIEYETEKPIVIITSVTVNDVVVDSMDYDYEGNTKYLDLPHDLSSFYFVFTILDYRMPAQSIFGYIFENNDDGWEYSEPLEYIMYDEIFPGDYIFKVKGANHYGIWNYAGDQVRIVINPPFWDTLWFKALMVVFAIGMLIGGHKWRTAKLRADAGVLEETVRDRTAELTTHKQELEQAKVLLEDRVHERTKELIEKNLLLEKEIREKTESEEKRKSLEEQLFQSQKMESIGRLAGGVAHDFNNILTAIMGYSELLKMRFRDTTKIEGQAADVIFNGAERAAVLTKQLLGFARRGKYNPVPLNVNEILKETVLMLERAFDKKVNIGFELDEKIGAIEADKSQMFQVFTNLMINAKDAMPNGGDLRIKTENCEIDSQYAEAHSDFPPGFYVKITVTDNGIGMAKEVVEHIFEPFYSTKGEGKGSGLGLAMVYGIVKNHGGHIHIFSEPGLGSTFTIYIPRSDKEVISETAYSPELVKGESTVLVVDDEEDVRSTAEYMLNELGYKVLFAVDGKDAIEKYKKHSGEIDIVLLDMIMPKKAGSETFLELKEIDPDIKVILSSGYSVDKKTTAMINDGVMGFLQKPYKIIDLSKILYEILNN